MIGIFAMQRPLSTSTTECEKMKHRLVPTKFDGVLDAQRSCELMSHG
jgi:hypothetical protein